ncbi:MAG: phospholipid carrier-dependent glycosyltransferase [Desulfobacteraceae bacterium]|nr:phospholipid carrier-dependent glycosyltransferase [Desulfobacteraceae bacterium]
MRSPKLYPLLALLVFLTVYILPLGVRPLFVPDETRYGEIPREMIATGNWVVPHLDGLRYFEKPVLGYWLNAWSLLLFGKNGFAIRFPSALAVGLSALVIFLLVRRTLLQQGGEEPHEMGHRLPSIAALAFLVCFEVAGVGSFAVLDSLLAFFLTGTMAFFFLATGCPPGSRQEKSWLLAAGVCCGLAFLTKGFLALAVPVVTVVPYLWWQRRFRDVLRLSWLPLLTALVVSLPWSLLIQSREPDYWRFFFWNEHVRRFLAANAQHPESCWFYFLAAPIMFLPWTGVVPAAAGGLRRILREDGPAADLTRYSLCWLLFPFLFFSAAHGKLLTYILPCFPPFAILLVLGLSRFFRQERSTAFQVGAAGQALLFGLLLAVLLFLQTWGYHGWRPYYSSWGWLGGAFGLAALLFFCLLAVRHRGAGPKTICLSLAPVPLFFLLPFTMPHSVLQAKAPGPLLQRHLPEITPETLIISDGEPVQAVCWFFRRDDVDLLVDAGELGYGLHYPAARHRLLDPAAARRLIDRNRGRAVLVATASDYQRWKASLPPAASEDNSGPEGYVFVKY